MPKRPPEFEGIKRFDAKKARLKEQPRNYIKMYREAKHLTQSELAEISGVHRTTIARLEQQGAKPHKYLAEMLAKALDVTVSQIYGVSVAPPYMDSTIYSPTKSGEYLCAFHRSGSHNYNYVVGYYDADTRTWSIPPWLNQIGGELPPSMVKFWTKIPEVVDIRN